jgi:predicted dehydrogenase
VQHVEAMQAVVGAELGAVESGSTEHARAAGERWGVPWTTDLEELLSRDDIDAITLCTPSGLHAEGALFALDHGKHVIIEKPLAMSVADADAVIAAGRTKGRLVVTISQRRFEPVMQALHSAITAGSFGRIVSVIGEGFYHRPQSYYDQASWRGTIAMDGGVLMNQAIHMVDLVRWIGGPVALITSLAGTLCHRMEAEDVASVAMRFTNGSLGVITATTCAETGLSQELRVYGEAGHARIAGEVVLEWRSADGTPPPAHAPVEETAISALAPPTWGTSATGHIRQYRDIVDAIREGRPPAVTGEDGMNAIEIVTAAYEASRTGRAISVQERMP